MAIPEGTERIRIRMARYRTCIGKCKRDDINSPQKNKIKTNSVDVIAAVSKAVGIHCSTASLPSLKYDTDRYPSELIVVKYPITISTVLKRFK